MADKLGMCMDDFLDKVTPQEIHDWEVYYYTGTEEFEAWHKREIEMEVSSKMTDAQKIAIAMQTLGVAKIDTSGVKKLDK